MNKFAPLYLLCFLTSCSTINNRNQNRTIASIGGIDLNNPANANIVLNMNHRKLLNQLANVSSEKENTTLPFNDKTWWDTDVQTNNGASYGENQFYRCHLEYLKNKMNIYRCDLNHQDIFASMPIENRVYKKSPNGVKFLYNENQFFYCFMNSNEDQKSLKCKIKSENNGPDFSELDSSQEGGLSLISQKASIEQSESKIPALADYLLTSAPGLAKSLFDSFKNLGQSLIDSEPTKLYSGHYIPKNTQCDFSEWIKGEDENYNLFKHVVTGVDVVEINDNQVRVDVILNSGITISLVTNVSNWSEMWRNDAKHIQQNKWNKEYHRITMQEIRDSVDYADKSSLKFLISPDKKTIDLTFNPIANRHGDSYFNFSCAMTTKEDPLSLLKRKIKNEISKLSEKYEENKIDDCDIKTMHDALQNNGYLLSKGSNGYILHSFYAGKPFLWGKNLTLPENKTLIQKEVKVGPRKIGEKYFMMNPEDVPYIPIGGLLYGSIFEVAPFTDVEIPKMIADKLDVTIPDVMYCAQKATTERDLFMAGNLLEHMRMTRELMVPELNKEANTAGIANETNIEVRPMEKLEN